MTVQNDVEGASYLVQCVHPVSLRYRDGSRSESLGKPSYRLQARVTQAIVVTLHGLTRSSCSTCWTSNFSSSCTYVTCAFTGDLTHRSIQIFTKNLLNPLVYLQHVSIVTSGPLMSTSVASIVSLHEIINTLKYVPTPDSERFTEGIMDSGLPDSMMRVLLDDESTEFDCYARSGEREKETAGWSGS